MDEKALGMTGTGTGINAERKGYGRGLILGLTMAETMLLLVFSLLLVAGTIIVRKELEAERAEEERQAAVSELEILKSREEGTVGRWISEGDYLSFLQAKNDLNNITSLLERPDGSPMPPDEVRELVWARDRIASAGLTPEEVARLAEEMFILKEAVITAEELRELFRLRETLAGQETAVEDARRLAPALSVLRESVLAGPNIEDVAKEMRAILRRFEIAEGDADPHDFPPIITLDEVRGYSFDTGSAELSDAFRERLPEVAGRIQEIANARGDIEIIEVIGHTDERAMPSAFSNLDRDIKPVLDGELPVGTLRPADNAGLGLARALSVAQSLASMPGLETYNILPMSGGQLILPGDILTDGDRISDDPSRRRIEIRMRRKDARH